MRRALSNTLAVSLLVCCELMYTAEAAHVIYLSAEQPHPAGTTGANDEEIITSNLAYREIVRQAVLMCAREKFGLVTRDATLREPKPDNIDEQDVFRLQIRTISGKRVEYELFRGERSLTQGELEYHFAHNASGLSNLATTTYRWAMNDLPSVFEAEGFVQRESNEIDLDDVAIAGEIANDLLVMDVLSQYLAVRTAHKAISKDGESMGRLAAIVQGYGNLCQLTEFYPMQMRVAFFARALMYGTRMIVMNPESPYGYWYRGHAHLLSGRSQDGWWDFEKAAELAGDEKKPAWLPLMELAYEFDFHALKHEALAEDQLQQLSILLWYRSVEFSGSQYLNLTVGKQCLAILPWSTRITNGMNRVAGVSYGHRTSVMGFQQFAGLLYQMMPKLIEHDEQVEAALSELTNPIHTLDGWIEARDALYKSSIDDNYELSLAVLAAMIEEEVMTATINRATFLRDSLSVDATEFLDAMKAFYANHPHAPLLETCRYRGGSSRKQVESLLGDFEAPEGSVYTVRNKLTYRYPRDIQFKHISAQEYCNQLWGNTTACDSDYMAMNFSSMEPKNALKYAGWMGGMFPNTPMRNYIYATHEWDKYKEDQEWIEKYGQHPVVSAAIARQYGNSGDYENAEKWYRRSMEGAPEFASYMQLISLYWNHLDEEEKAIEAARQFMLEEDFGLQHANISRYMAYSLLARDRPDEALVWGKRAGESYSGWGLIAQANCHEAIGELEKALELYQASDQRYNTSDRYFFVARTAQGDLDEAWRFHQQSRLRSNVSDYSRKDDEAYHALYTHDLKEAFAKFMEISQADGQTVYIALLHAAAIADELEDDAQRDALWQQISEMPEELRPANSINAYQKQLADALIKSRDQQLLSFDEVKQLHSSPYYATYAENHYFFGMYCQALGEKERAIQHFQEAAKVSFPQRGVVIDAWVRLRDLGVDTKSLHPRYWYGLKRFAFNPPQ